MQFAGIANPFGAQVSEPPTTTSSSTLYYKGMRLERRPARIPAPKPLSHYLRNFILS